MKLAKFRKKIKSFPNFEKPPEDIITPIKSWAKKHRILSANESDFKGNFSYETRPYQEEMLEAIGDRRAEEVVFMLASQLGKTIIMTTGLAWYLCEMSGTRAMYMLPTSEEAKKYSRIRFSAMQEEMPVLSNVISELRRGQTLLQKMLKNGGWLNFVASGSSSQLSGMPSNVVFVDEYSRCSTSAKSADGRLDEGDPLTLLRKRCEESIDKKFVIVGTPTVKGLCPTFDRFLLSDQRYYEVPCPKCKSTMFLDWEKKCIGKERERGFKTITMLTLNAAAAVKLLRKLSCRHIKTKLVVGSNGIQVVR